jgi:N-acetylglutamate synthase-like GNAT family acetyltransferase
MIAIREALQSDTQVISALLLRNELRAEGVLEPHTHYWVAEKDARIVGAIGLEPGYASVLLRSAIVDRNLRGHGLGQELTRTALTFARTHGYRAAYCFSTDAGDYWRARGFDPCPVDEVTRALPNAPQVRLFDRLGWLPAELAWKYFLADQEE